MNQEITTVLLSEAEAREHVEAIKESYIAVGANLITLRQQLLSLYEGEGWRALSYGSWKECCEAEFKQSQSRIYDLLTQAKIEKQIGELRPGVIVSGEALKRLQRTPPKVRTAIVETAVEMAREKVTPKVVEQAAERVQLATGFQRSSGPMWKDDQAKSSYRKSKHDCPTCRC